MAGRIRANATDSSTQQKQDTEMPDLAARNLATGTRGTYRRSSRRFDEWLDGPPTDAALADYLVVLFERGIAPATAGVAVAAVADRAKREGLPSPLGERTARALSAFRRDAADRGPGQVVGISWKQADRMADLARASGNPAGLRDALLIRLASDCLLRVAEASELDVADISLVDDWLQVVVRRSKTDQEGKGRVLYAGPPTADLAGRWLRIGGIADGSLFHPVNKAGRIGPTRLSARTMREIIKRRAAQAGIKGRVSGHSLRVGAAQSLRDAGATMPELMAAGRWERAETVACYISTQDAAAGPVARLRYGVVPQDDGRRPQNRQGSYKRLKRVARRAKKAARESRRARRESKHTRKAVKKIEKTLARIEKAVIDS